MVEGFLDEIAKLGGFLKNPGPYVVAVFSFVVCTPITFLAVQTFKRLKFSMTGTQWPAYRIQLCSWAWFILLSILFQVVLYWDTESQVPWNIAAVTTVVGVVCYIGMVEWWIEIARKHYPDLWARIRTDRRSRQSDSTPGDTTSDDITLDH